MNSKELDNTSRKQNAREALLKAAQRLFTERGYQAVSTRDLAEEAQVNLGAIQYHFGSKAALFVETIYSMMQGGACATGSLMLGAPARDPEEAAYRLCGFLYSFLDYLLRPKGPQACRLMFREVLGDTSRDQELLEALVTSFIRDFSGPTRDALVGKLAIINPRLSKTDLNRSANSLMGQCAFYFTHRPFAERLDGESYDDPTVFREIGAHICAFSLRGLGCEEDFVKRVVSRVNDTLHTILSDFQKSE
jgi:AcrR family transcriptional regulator